MKTKIKFLLIVGFLISLCMSFFLGCLLAHSDVKVFCRSDAKGKELYNNIPNRKYIVYPKSSTPEDISFYSTVFVAEADFYVCVNGKKHVLKLISEPFLFVEDTNANGQLVSGKRIFYATEKSRIDFKID